ncbi:MAG: CBS domain-containing protein [Rhodospirillales bacterium]
MHHRKLQDIVAGQNLLHVTGALDIVSVAKRMAERNVAALLVIEGGTLMGIFTERDLLRRVVAVGLEPARTKLADVMTTEIVTLDGGRLGFEAAVLMIERGIRHVVVSGLPDPGYGIVSIRDFAHGEMSSFEKEIEFEKKVWSSI